MTLTAPTTTPEPVTPRERSLRHEPALDGLRGLAVAGVLLFHGDHLAGGYLGVDAFFVLSGFLITTLLLVEHGNQGRISLGHFWARRARRLLPALAGVLAAVAVYAAFVAQPGELPTIRGDAFSTIFYFANWHAIAAGSDYFAIFRSPSPLQHTWSLAIEEQFYLVWPLALVALLRRSADIKTAAKRVLAFSLGLATASVVLAQMLYNAADPSRVYYGADTRAAAILFGAALAAALVVWGPVAGARARRALEAVALIAMAMLALAWSQLSGSSNFLYRGGLVLCGIAVAVVIAAAVHPERGPVARVLSFKPLCGLGIISYGVYLWHWPVFVWLTEDRAGVRGWPLFGLQCAITLAVALASYRFVERPIRRGWGTRRVMLIGAPAIALALVVALVVATPAPTLSVFARLGNTRTVPLSTDTNWQLALEHLRSARQASGSTTRVLVFGDSVALSLAVGIPDGIYQSADADGAAIGLLGCSLQPTNRIVRSVAYRENPRCRAWPTLLAQAIDAYQPAIVATMLGPWEIFDRETPNGRENAGSPQLTTAFVAQFTRLYEIVKAHGAHLTVLNTPCFSPPKYTPHHENEVWGDTKRVAWLNEVWSQFTALHSDVSRADLAALLCPGGRPIETTAGHRYRSDGMHFTHFGARLFWGWLDDKVVKPFNSAPAPRG